MGPNHRATVKTSGKAVRTTTTRTDGSYTLNNMERGTYTVRPSHSSYHFTPAFHTAAVTTHDVTSINFTASPNASQKKGSKKPYQHEDPGLFGHSRRLPRARAADGDRGRLLLRGRRSDAVGGAAWTAAARSCSAAASGCTSCRATTSRPRLTSALCREVRPAPFPRAELRGRRLPHRGPGLLQLRRRSTRPANTAKRRWPSAWPRSPALKPLVLICHCPPYGTPLDRVREGVHAGSHAVRRVHRGAPAGVLLLRPHPRGRRGRRRGSGATRGFNAGPKGRLLDFDKLEDV